ncbi:MAG: gliding motility-associated C-terminal domain-containing protein [Bacteroidales bacterium]|nr:gliding motility-associated C-terminal domain-containing protein [Bacteroidales bacterium]
MKKIVSLIIITLLCGTTLFGTHNRAGEITLRQLDEYTYEILITTFTYTLSQADRSSLEVQWGDNTISSALRTSITRLPNFYQKNIYIAQHTFPGAGTYEIVVQDPNRNLGVKNIPNSVNVVFSIKTTITINPSIGMNSTPVLLNPPIDRAALNQIFIHNPAAYDPDGDSISYKLTVCTEEDGKPIENYTYPLSSDTLYIDPVTGDLNWITPVEKGVYNIAINVEEWRQGVKIGNIVRDMQIEVYETDNHPPELDSIQDFCIEAGTNIAFRVMASDIDNDSIDLTATGGPFILENSPALFTTDKSAADVGRSEGDFIWLTDCSHVRQQSYNVIFKAEDSNPETRLVDIFNVNIKVIGSAPETPSIIPSSNSITLTWEEDPCPLVTGYHVYRKSGPSGYTPDSCVAGVPAYTGYTIVGELKGRDRTFFIDDNKGKGLEQGSEYCYMITAVYPDGAESFPSGEACSPLIAGVPAMIQTSVISDNESGDIELRWIQPRELDTIPANGPYEYIISRSTGIFGGEDREVFIMATEDISDTVFTDTDVNTLSGQPYNYQLTLYNNAPGNRFAISDLENIEEASSLFPELTGSDNQILIEMKKNVPWINYDYTIYRQNDATGLFDSIGYTTRPLYTDNGLENNKTYCYRVKSRGWRSIDDQLFENVNYSHVNCTQPVDSVAPCTPILSGRSYCDAFYNLLTWRFTSDTCFEDVMGFNLYFSETQSGTPELLSEYESERNDTSYIHDRTGLSLTGCYYISAVDSFGNESPLSVQLCLDECSSYILPNVFSPDGRGKNNLFIPNRTAYVEKVDFQVFNRWGLLVFRTEDPDLNWDGKILGSDRVVSPGVYYYICEVFEPRLNGIESYTLTGFIHVFSGNENEVNIE